MIAIGAVFLALALGILIGVSFGDSILAANERNIMELMEERLDKLQELRRQQDQELRCWEEVKPLLLRGFRGALAGKEIALFSYSAGEAGAVKGLLEGSGAAVTVILVQPRACGSEESREPPLAIGEKGEEPPFGPGMLAAGELEPLGLHFQEGGASLEWPPDCCLFLPGREGNPPDGFLKELWRALHERGFRAIALFPRSERAGTPVPPGMKNEPSLVDNIDTFWGQVALLMMLAEKAAGHYGFDSSGKGLFPEPAEAE